jgi:hypothetical protein
MKDDKVLELFPEVLLLVPFRKELYEFMLQRFGDELNELGTIKDFFLAPIKYRRNQEKNDRGNGSQHKKTNERYLFRY